MPEYFARVTISTATRQTTTTQTKSVRLNRNSVAGMYSVIITIYSVISNTISRESYGIFMFTELTEQVCYINRKIATITEYILGTLRLSVINKIEHVHFFNVQGVSNVTPLS